MAEILINQIRVREPLAWQFDLHEWHSAKPQFTPRLSYFVMGLLHYRAFSDTVIIVFYITHLFSQAD